jgi:hypothetical protein
MSKLLDEGRAPAQPPQPAPPPPGPRLVPTTPEEGRLRAEHDELQARVAARISVDRSRRGLQLLFTGFLGVLLSGKLAWDRWGVLPPGVRRETPPGIPLYLYAAMTATVVVLVLAIRAFLAARRLAREEDAVFARLLQVRSALGLDR